VAHSIEDAYVQPALEFTAHNMAITAAIRATRADSQFILVPAADWSGARSFVQGSASTMSSVVDYDGSTSKLIYDIHQHYDSDGSGTHTTCTTDRVSDGVCTSCKVSCDPLAVKLS